MVLHLDQSEQTKNAFSVRRNIAMRRVGSTSRPAAEYGGCACLLAGVRIPIPRI